MLKFNMDNAEFYAVFGACQLSKIVRDNLPGLILNNHGDEVVFTYRIVHTDYGTNGLVPTMTKIPAETKFKKFLRLIFG